MCDLAYLDTDKAKEMELTPEYLHSKSKRTLPAKSCFDVFIVEIPSYYAILSLLFNITWTGSGTVFTAFKDTHTNWIAFALGSIQVFGLFVF